MRQLKPKYFLLLLDNLEQRMCNRLGKERV